MFIVSGDNLLIRILKAESQLESDVKLEFLAILCKTVSPVFVFRVKSAPSSVSKCTTGLFRVWNNEKTILITYSMLVSFWLRCYRTCYQKEIPRYYRFIISVDGVFLEIRLLFSVKNYGYHSKLSWGCEKVFTAPIISNSMDLIHQISVTDRWW